ncbi:MULTISPECIES: DHA2 family efflux MFS transporter permease subunit [unclassified Nocardia]|uniref:DHA2 family efflux MFS transporter permease subunit n=1 Tax=unclassified Nocardia TaxID=2637762 RepID=UPI001CE48013|nr:MULTISPECIES: DHA2 family efflux MFS transporter permease subunit [unclassified Nocardia]
MADGWRRWAALGAVCLAALLIGIANTVVNVALPALGGQLGASTSALQWVIDAYILVLAGLLLVGGYLGDRYGRKRMLLLGLALFALASLAAGCADSAGALIAARAVLGGAAALIYPATLASIAATFTDRAEKATAVGIWSAVSGLSVALGPLAGGLLLAHFHWGAVFFVNLPVVAATFAAVLVAVPESRGPVIGRLDRIGAAAAIIGTGLLVWAIIEAPQRGWLDPVILAAFAASALVLVVFFRWERRTRHPLLDIRLFRDRRFSIASWSITTAYFGLVGFSFMITFFFQTVRGYSPLRAGLATIPYAVVVAATAPLAMTLTRRFGTKIVVAVGLSLMSCGFLLASTIGVRSAYLGPILPSMCVMAAGLACVTGPATDALLNTVPPSRAGVVSAVNDTTRELGAALGVAVLGSAMSWTYRDRLARLWSELNIPGALVERGRGSAVTALTAAPDATAADGARLAFVDGLRTGAFAAAAVTAIGALLAIALLPQRDRTTTDHPASELAALAG